MSSQSSVDMGLIDSQLNSYDALMTPKKNPPTCEEIAEAKRILLSLRRLTGEPGFSEAGTDFRNFSGVGDRSDFIAVYLNGTANSQAFILKELVGEMIKLKHDILVSEPYQDLPAQERIELLNPTPIIGGGWDPNQPKTGCYSRVQIDLLKPHYNSCRSIVIRLLDSMLDDLPQGSP